METFDAGLGTSTLAVTDNVTIAGFYAFRTVANATPNTFTASSGGSNIGRFYNYGPVGPDSSAGAIVSAANGTSYLGLRYSNAVSPGVGVVAVTVSYRGEQWRRGSAGAETLAFSYQVGTTVTSLTAGTWTPVTALDFVSPNNVGAGGSIDGNVNSATITSTFVVSTPGGIPSGSEIMLRWQDSDDPDADHGLAIDDVAVTFAVPSAAPASLGGRVTTANGTGIRGAIISVQSIEGEVFYASTNTFGNFTVNGLQSGESYFVSVAARRYGFAQPTQFVNLSENLTNLRFTASY